MQSPGSCYSEDLNVDDETDLPENSRRVSNYVIASPPQSLHHTTNKAGDASPPLSTKLVTSPTLQTESETSRRTSEDIYHNTNNSE